MRGQLQLLVIVDIDGAGAHQVDTIGVLQAGLGVVDQHLVAFAVIPAAVTLIGNRQAAGSLIGATADRCRHVFIVIAAAVKAGFTAKLELNLFFFLALLGHDVNQATGAAAAVQRGSPGNHFNMGNVERID